MTLLQIMSDTEPDRILARTRDEDEIREHLAPHGVEFSRWTAPDGFDPDAGEDGVLSAYSTEVDHLKRERGFHLVDVVRLRPDDSDPAVAERARKARGTFLDEHRHDEDEVRYFASGTGCFYLHLDGVVAAVVCEAGDLLSVPAGTRHWFDMGERPDFVSIRFFEEEDGWVGDFTGDPISASFPSLDDLLALR